MPSLSQSKFFKVLSQEPMRVFDRLIYDLEALQFSLFCSDAVEQFVHVTIRTAEADTSELKRRLDC